VLGLLQGLTEFIPVSSSGHLVIIPWLLNWPSPGLTYDVMVHLGTLLAVLLYLKEDIVRLGLAWWTSVRRRSIDTTEARLAWFVLLSMVPGAILGALFNDVIERFFGLPRIAAVLLLVTGLLLVASEWLGHRARALQEMTWRDGLAIGVAQAVAIAPGLSRSGATIAAGLLRGLRRDDAARFSFLMSVPIIAGAAVMQIWGSVQGGISPGEPLHWVIGLVASLVSGYLAIRFLLRYLQLHSLRPFAYYCWTVGILTLLLTFVR
jgi:undecaprenyl-diphosphatase